MAVIVSMAGEWRIGNGILYLDEEALGS